MIAIRALALSLMLMHNLVYASSSTGPDSSRALVDGALANYQTTYPDIQFVHLQDPLDLDRLNEIYSSFGVGTENVDYEHPVVARAMLLAAQRRRIEIMLEERLPSATLFKIKQQPAVERFICVLTLDPALFSGEPGVATRLLSDGLDLEARAQLDNEAFLRFTINHEVFHCLDAYVNGPTRTRTDSFVTESYDDYRAEQRADLYAGLAHQTRYKSSDHFLRTVAMYRALSILDWDLAHFSAPILLKLLTVDPSFSAGLTLAGRVRFAMKLADHWLLSAKQYQAFAVSAALVIMKSNRTVARLPLYQELLDGEFEEDPQIVAEVSDLLRRAKTHVTTTTLASFGQ